MEQGSRRDSAGDATGGKRNYERSLDFSGLNAAHASSVAAESLDLTLQMLSNAGLTSREKTGEPSGSGGAE